MKPPFKQLQADKLPCTSPCLGEVTVQPTPPSLSSRERTIKVGMTDSLAEALSILCPKVGLKPERLRYHSHKALDPAKIWVVLQLPESSQHSNLVGL